MNPNLDPIVAGKIDDFRIRRRNLILLRGLCSGVLSFLGTFVLIALLDYLSGARMSSDLRIGLSIAGYIFVFYMVWKTSISALLNLPNSKELAKLLEQSSPDLKEDLLSAVELGIIHKGMDDSIKFRELVQKQASSKASKIDIKTILPVGKLKNWLIGTSVIIVITLSLLQIPEFGSDLKLLMQRALMPNANLPPVTHFAVRILSPDENTTRTPSNEPLRFVASIKAKRKNLSFEKVSLETRSPAESKITGLAKREEEIYFIDYNVGNQNFEYRLLVDKAPQTEWKKMGVRPRPYIKSYQKNFKHPTYSELQPQQITEPHGDLEAWEGTEIELSMLLNQPVKSGTIEIQWTGKSGEVRKLTQTKEEDYLKSTIQMTYPGTYRITNLIDRKMAWKGRPSSTFTISPKPDLAPSVEWIEPQERSLLVAPNDLLSFSALAKDDLGLARVEYVIKKNQGKWRSFPIPQLIDPRGQNTAAFEFNLDLLNHKLKSGTQAFLKLQVTDLKGTKTETEVIQLSIVSRDFDLSLIELLGNKSKIKEYLDKIDRESSESQKNIQGIIKDFKQKKINRDAFLEKALQMQSELSIEAESSYGSTIQSLLKMPRGTDSYEVSMYATAIGQIFLNSAKSFNHALEAIERESNINLIYRSQSKLSSISSKRRSKAANFRNLSQDLLNLHAESIAVSYLHSMLQRQVELSKNMDNKESISFLSRRQQVALSQWDPISNSLSYSRDWTNSSVIKRVKAIQLKLIDSLDENGDNGNELKKQIEEWERTIKQISHDVENKIASKYRQSIQQKQTEQLYWNLSRNDLLWSETDKLWKSLDKAKGTKLESNIHDLVGKIDVLIADAMMLSEVEQARKDQNSFFVKDAGQIGRALMHVQKEIRGTDINRSETWTELSEKSEKLGASFQILTLQHQLIGSANQVIYFMRKENGNSLIWEGTECARQWSRVQSVWKPILEMMKRESISSEAIEIMKKLPNQSYTKTLIQETHRRSASVKYNHQWILKEAELVFNDLKKIISIIKQDVISARTFVNEQAPTLPELARELAKETEKQKNKLQENTDDNTSLFVDKKNTLKELNSQQKEIGRDIANFAQALRQEANIQNLLDEEGREIARDSDDAAALIQQREDDIEKNLQEITATQSIDELNEASVNTIKKQEELITDLNLIAEHFDRLNNLKPPDKTRAELRAKEERLEIAEEIEKQYQEAEKLSQLAALSPKELLEELEVELKQNPTMQRELSDIALDTVERAKKQLEDAQSRESNLVDQIENEENNLKNRKTELGQKLRELAKETEHLVQQKLEPLEEKAKMAKNESISEETDILGGLLRAISRDTMEAVNQKPNAQELKEISQDLADILGDTSKDLDKIAKKLEEQAELSPAQAQQLARDTEQLAKKQKNDAKSLRENLTLLKAQAQEAKQEDLKKKNDRNQAKETVEKAKQKAEDAKKMAEQTPNDYSLKENQLKAENQLTKSLEELEETQTLSSLAAQQSENLNEIAKAAQAEADEAEKVAEQNQIKAMEASNLSGTLNDEILQKPAADASKQGTKIAEEASKQAQTLQEQVEEISKALDELTESADGSPELLSEAIKTQKELSEDTFDTSEKLAKAARHEERLDNLEESEVLKNLAESTEEIALMELPQTTQAIENQLLANKLKDLANDTQKLADELEESNLTGEENLPNELSQQAEEIADLLDQDPSLTSLQKETAELNELAEKAEAELSEFAENNEGKAEAAKRVAKKALEAADQAKEEMAKANEKAKAAADLLKSPEAGVQQPSEDQGEGLVPQEGSNPFSAMARDATEDFTKAKDLAEAEQAIAKQAVKEANQATQLAESAAKIKQASEELLEQFSNPPNFAELEDKGLPHAGIAINNAGNSFEEKLDVLEDFERGEMQETDKPLSNSEPEKEISPNPTTVSPDNFGNLDYEFETATNFSDPEVSEVLAQTLDALDEAIFASENSVSDSYLSPKHGQPEQSTETTEPETNRGKPGKPKPGNGSGAGNGGPLTSMNHSDQAIAQALQSLRQATQAHAQVMAQQRSQVIRSMGTRGDQLNSSEGQFLPTPVIEINKLPSIQEKISIEDWGKLPPKLAKDLMEAKREKVSENYRNQVQAYFQAMSAKARTTKK